MLKIILDKPKEDFIYLDTVKEYEPVFAKREGKFKGMIVREEKGWILRLGDDKGSSGHHSTLEECIEKDSEFGYEFFVEG